ncbi:hypothetical protein [Priestia filamentosa]|uniref:hypothetical protein n=1 Tax=Priestia filamentosa TaxID=1402861 RepID=UPI000A08A938|nr:hypothetical protein [Priestia filamentosa]OXS69841.1 hypothetical protein B1B01_12885 [Priestia filamentosa]SMF36750.1 hypothetical protein SAMN06296056_1021156 [Priestia filamentosa]
MRYDKRAVLYRIEQKETPLGVKEKMTPYPVACNAQILSVEEQTAIYGAVSQHRVKLHMKGKVREVEKVEFEGEIYEITLTKHFRHSTILYLERMTPHG